MPYPSANRVRRRGTGTPVADASLRQESPDCRNSAALSTSNSFAGLPQCFPRRCASFMPATTLCRISSRLNSAIAASTENTSLPSGPEVSMDCVTDTKSIPRVWNCSRANTSSRVDLAKWSNFQTAITSNRRLLASFIIRSSTGRIERGRKGTSHPFTFFFYYS